MKSPLAGMKSPLAGMKSPLAGMNGPLVGICTSGARVRRHVGGEREHGAAGPAALKIHATREDPDRLRCLAVGLQRPVPRADETGMAVPSVRYGNGKEMKQNAIL
jgi:hypothetical protein